MSYIAPLEDVFRASSPHKCKKEAEEKRRDGGEGKQINVFLSMSEEYTDKLQALWQI